MCPAVVPPVQVRGKTEKLERAQWKATILMIRGLENLMHENIEEIEFICDGEEAAGGHV